MRKIGWIFVLVLILCGCSEQEVLETMKDDHVQSVMQEERTVLLSVPEEALTIRGEVGVLYLCDGYEVATQVVAAGDLNQTVKTITGFESDALTVMATAAMDHTRYEWVWSAAGEAGDVVGRGVILDDGVYHYCLTVTADAAQAANLQTIWQQILESYRLA